MRPRQLGLAAVVVAALAGAAWWLLARQSSGAVEEAGRLLPGFDARVGAIDAIEVAGAGGKTLVRIEKHEGEPDPPIAPEQACPGCGKYHTLTLLWVDEDALGNRRRVPA